MPIIFLENVKDTKIVQSSNADDPVLERIPGKIKAANESHRYNAWLSIDCTVSLNEKRQVWTFFEILYH